MRSPLDVFHLAIPVQDLDDARRFYVEGLGCTLARRYADRVTLNFFGDQVVCHLSDHVDAAPQLYPRHFGVTFRNRREWERLLNRSREHDLPFFVDPFRRFDGQPEGHDAFVLRDPSNNLLEFKHYDNPHMMY
ncbi:MAG: VOC family protein [Pseudonocardiales bacterium]|nr:VOC family protein [Pseudonocardiales bacterium]MBV9729821.1 VOC family protein [Pseudonocardiales bacterium]